MDIDLLKTFLEVSHTRHFGKAAENLYLTQSAVSARIRQLENLLGCPLFIRTRHNIRLTVAGERLVPHAQTILTTLHQARQGIALVRNQQHLALGAASSIWDILLLEQVIQLMAADTALYLQAESMSPESLSRRLLERSLDLCVMFEPPKMDEFLSTVLTSVDLILVASEQHERDWLPTAPENRWLLMEWGGNFSSELARALPDLPLPVLQTNSVHIALETLLRLGGCSYLPATVASPYLANGQLWHMTAAPTIRRNVYISWRRDNHNLPNLDQIIQTLMRQLS